MVGLVVGWLASQITSRDSTLGSILIAIAGAFAAGFSLPMMRLHLPFADPVIGSIVTASMGAILALFLARLISRG